MASICKRYIITGKVQGVFFRRYACKEAREHDITGWVRNLPDGSVELLACGMPDKLGMLENWLWKGPSAGRVEKVEAHEQPFENHSSFVILCSDQA